MSNHIKQVSSVVAIPVCNERDWIVDCLSALAAQTGVDRASYGILLFLNNCTDDTRRTVEFWMAGSSCAIRIIEQDSDAASAGWARREAMNAAAAWLEEIPVPDGVLLTTDADSRVPADWIASNIAALRAGAAAVAGRVTYDFAESEPSSERLQLRQKIEFDYEMLLAEVEARLDPRQGNPWPCHWMSSGASIAVRLDAFRRVGGLPDVTSGEDHAFIDLVRSHGLVVRHAPEIVVVTSARLDGRARDGAAATLKRRSVEIDSPCDIRLEPLMTFAMRTIRRRLGSANYGFRRRRPLRPSELPRQIRRARILLNCLRALEARRADRGPSVAHLSARIPEPLSTP